VVLCVSCGVVGVVKQRIPVRPADVNLSSDVLEEQKGSVRPIDFSFATKRFQVEALLFE
jgi:hypothetical protein